MIAIIDTAPFIMDIGIVLLLAAASGLLARRAGLPAIVGYLLVGLIVSPFTPGYVADPGQISVLADIGVVLLLFEVGIEVDLRRVSREQGSLLWLAPLQVIFTMSLTSAVLMWQGVPTLGALLLGVGVAMSSSVVIVNITRSRRRTTDPATDDALLGWSVLQDVTGVAVAAIVLALFGTGDGSVWLSLGGLAAFAVIAYIAARLLPRLLLLVRWEHDLFLIFSVATGLALSALGTVLFDIPMALAAFVAGLTINNRDTNEIRRVLLPFRDLFAVLFFVVIGSLIRPSGVAHALPAAAGLLLLLLLFKTLPIAILARRAGLRARPRQLAVGLSQMGEFSYVLGTVAVAQAALTSDEFVAILLVVVATIILSTVLVPLVAPKREQTL